MIEVASKNSSKQQVLCSLPNYSLIRRRIRERSRESSFPVAEPDNLSQFFLKCLKGGLDDRQLVLLRVTSNPFNSLLKFVPFFEQRSTLAIRLFDILLNHDYSGDHHKDHSVFQCRCDRQIFQPRKAKPPANILGHMLREALQFSAHSWRVSLV